MFCGTLRSADHASTNKYIYRQHAFIHKTQIEGDTHTDIYTTIFLPKNLPLHTHTHTHTLKETHLPPSNTHKPTYIHLHLNKAARFPGGDSHHNKSVIITLRQAGPTLPARSTGRCCYHNKSVITLRQAGPTLPARLTGRCCYHNKSVITLRRAGHTLPSCSLTVAMRASMWETSSSGLSLFRSWALRHAALHAASMAGSLCLVSWRKPEVDGMEFSLFAFQTFRFKVMYGSFKHRSLRSRQGE